MELSFHRGGSGAPLVLLHGIGSRWQIWTPLLDELEARFDVIAPDLPGFGASPMAPPRTPAGVDSLCTLVLAWLQSEGVAAGSFSVAGNSLGGLMALELGARNAARTVCALSPGGFSSRAETAYIRATLRSSIALARGMSSRAEQLNARPGARRLLNRTFYAHPERVPAQIAAGDLRAFAHAPWFDETLAAIEPWSAAAGELPPEGKEISVPVTIAWGAKDRLLFPRQARRAQAEIPQARMVSLAGCGHIPTFDDPALVARVITESTEATAV